MEGTPARERGGGQVPPEWILDEPAPPPNATPTKKLAYERAQAAKYEQGILALTAKLKEMEQKVAQPTPQTVPRRDAGTKRKRPSPVKEPVYKKDGEADQSTEPWKTIFPRAGQFAMYIFLHCI